jgi:hypothetical protein
MLANAEEIHADPVGQLGFGDDVAEDVCLRLESTFGVRGDVAEGIQAELDICHVEVTGGSKTGFPSGKDGKKRNSSS